jgi:hypothetical protein
MDLFDRRILAVLKDGKPRGFQHVLSEVDFSRNTLRLHLEPPLFQQILGETIFISRNRLLVGSYRLESTFGQVA